MSNGYMKVDPKKATRALHAALSASVQSRVEDGGTRAWLQTQIFEKLLPLDPAYCETSAAKLEGTAQNSAISALVIHYSGKKQFSHALTLLTQARGEFPYPAGIRLLQSLPPTMNEQGQAVFSQALASYSQHEHSDAADNVAVDDFPKMVLIAWKRLHPDLVMQAIDEVLSQAKHVDNSMHVTVGAKNGAASFTSFYQYRVFELAPVLNKLAPNRVESLLQENADLKDSLRRFPNGVQSLDPKLQLDVTFRSASAGGGSTASDRYRMELGARADEIIGLANKDPDKALEAARSLPDLGMRAYAQQGIARSAIKTHPATARTAAEELEKSTDTLPLLDQARFLAVAADVDIKIGETDSALKVINRGFDTAKKFYQQDGDNENPNAAWKAYWPSTAVWRVFTLLAARISIDKALESVQQIDDPEIRVLDSVSLANDLLGVAPTSMMVRLRNGSTNYLQAPPST